MPQEKFDTIRVGHQGFVSELDFFLDSFISIP